MNISSVTTGGRGKRVAITAAGMLLTAAMLTACSSNGSGSGSGSKAPIKIGQITTESGGYPFGDVVKGTQSYVNMLNAKGGLDGHKIQFTSGDDKGDASEASQLARKLVQQNGVVGMVGNTSLADCQTNKGFYEANNIEVIGGGTQPACNTQPNWTPVNSGPFADHLVSWKYAFTQLKGKDAVCDLDQNDPTSIPYFKQLAAQTESELNVKFKLLTFTNDNSKNPTPAVANAKAQGCKIIMLSDVAANFAAFVKAAKAVGLDATFVGMGSVYDASLPATLGALGEPGALGPDSQGVFVGAELAPITDTNANVQAMVTQLKKDGVTANFWSEIGWVSALVFFDGLKQGASKYDITTASGVKDALKAMSPVDTGFAATKLFVGSGDTHAPNLGNRMLTIKNGEFVAAPGTTGAGWTTIDSLPAAK